MNVRTSSFFSTGGWEEVKNAASYSTVYGVDFVVAPLNCPVYDILPVAPLCLLLPVMLHKIPRPLETPELQ